MPFSYGSTSKRFFDDLIIANELKKHMRNADGLKVIDVEYTLKKRHLQVLRLIRRYEIPFDSILDDDWVTHNSIDLRCEKLLNY